MSVASATWGVVALFAVAAPGHQQFWPHPGTTESTQQTLSTAYCTGHAPTTSSIPGVHTKTIPAYRDSMVTRTTERTWETSRTIRAAVLRDILRGRLAPDPDPHGLRLRGARIAGRLDLENLTTGVAVSLSDCLLSDGLVARDATLPALVLSGCRLEHPTQPPLVTDRFTTTALFLDRAVIMADCETGAVRLLGAHLSWAARAGEAPAPWALPVERIEHGW
jgi:hypothetical protein